jgi:hypothetical protein
MHKIIFFIAVILLIIYIINKNKEYENFTITINNIKTKNDVKNNFYNILTNIFPNITPVTINALLKKYKVNNNYMKICDNLKNNKSFTGELAAIFIINVIGFIWLANLTLLVNNKLELSYNYFSNISLIKDNQNKYKINIYKVDNTDTIVGLYNSSNHVKPLEYMPINDQTELTDECLTKMCYTVFDQSIFKSDSKYHKDLLKLIELNVTRFLMKLNKSNLDTINKDIKDQLTKFSKTALLHQHNDLTITSLNNFVIN